MASKMACPQPTASHQTGQRATTVQAWRQMMTSLYPNLHTSSIYVPPLIVNRVPYTRDTVAGQPVLVVQQPLDNASPQVSVLGPVPRRRAQTSTRTFELDAGMVLFHKLLSALIERHIGSQSQQPQSKSQGQSQQPPTPCLYSMWSSDPNPHVTPDKVWASDVRDDFAQQHFLTNLQTLSTSRQEVMFVLSQLDFDSYLKDLTCPGSLGWFCRPANCGKKFAKGDFDMIVIHRHHGILIGEIKSVGLMHDQLNKTQPERDQDVTKRIRKAITQLDKCEYVVTRLVADIAPALMVRKTIILPFVSSAHLLSILSKDSALNLALCKCLGAADAAEATRLCVCSDQLSDRATPWKVTQADLTNLTTWWQNRMACAVDNSLTDLVYLDIVASTHMNAVSVIGHQDARFKTAITQDNQDNLQ